MNIYEKLQNCRVELNKSGLKKSGHNDFSHYDYFELGDFLPKANELFRENKLCGVVTFSPEKAVLKIIDTEKVDDVIEFYCPNADATLKGCHAIQNIGAIQTYQRRYLYTAALEISENDILNNNEPTEQHEDLTENLIDETKVKTIKALLIDTLTKEEQFCEYYGIPAIDFMDNNMFIKCMSALTKKKEKQVKNSSVQEPDI